MSDVLIDLFRCVFIRVHLWPFKAFDTAKSASLAHIFKTGPQHP